jgi:hypothetical protein
MQDLNEYLSCLIQGTQCVSVNMPSISPQLVGENPERVSHLPKASVLSCTIQALDLEIRLISAQPNRYLTYPQRNP